MTTSFRRPYTVIRRNLGRWEDGQYILDEDIGTRITVFATIQEPNTGDRNLIETLPFGRRAGRHIKIYTNTRLETVSQATSGNYQSPGDLILFDGKTYLLYGESDFNALQRARSSTVSHWRYFACEVIEGAAMDGAP